jgi:hypothetical protein
VLNNFSRAREYETKCNKLITGITHIEIDVWMILRRPVSNAFELAAAYAHHRHPDFIMKLRMTFHLQCTP